MPPGSDDANSIARVIVCAGWRICLDCAPRGRLFFVFAVAPAESEIELLGAPGKGPGRIQERAR